MPVATAATAIAPGRCYHRGVQARVVTDINLGERPVYHVIGEHATSEIEGDVHAHALYELRCDTDRWSDNARSCLATISSDDEADGCLTRLLDREQQRRLAADRAQLAAERDDAHE